MFTRSRSLWVHKLRGTWNWKCDKLLEWGCGLVGGEYSKATVLEGMTVYWAFQSRNAMKILQERHSLRSSGRGKREQKTLWSIFRVFHNRILLFMEGVCQSTVLKNNSARIKGIPLYSSSIQPSVGPKVGRGWITGNWGLNQKVMQHFYPLYPVTTPTRIQESHNRLQLKGLWHIDSLWEVVHRKVPKSS